MKLLFDNNLSVKLPKAVEDLFPGSAHVFELRLERATDRHIFQFARENDFTIVTKDKDFYHLQNILGAPPKLIWLTLGNSSNAALTNAITKNKDIINQFLTGDKTLLIVDS